jgi:hypothetical protein
MPAVLEKYKVEHTVNRFARRCTEIVCGSGPEGFDGTDD